MKLKFKVKHIVFLIVAAIVLAALIAGNVVCYFQSGVITAALCGMGGTAGVGAAEASAEGDKMVRELAEESIVLLKNDGTLPLSDQNKRVNLFGASSTDDGYLGTGIGSGAASISENSRLTLVKAFEEAGVTCNPDLAAAYEKLGWGNVAKQKSYELRNPSADFYTQELIAGAKQFSDIAIVVLSRVSGENMVNEVPLFQTVVTEKGKTTNAQRTYLEITEPEESLLEIVCSNFGSVIVLLNTCNDMHTGFLNDERIDAALFVGATGQSGTAAIPKILYGSVAPSGKLADTYAYEPESAPSFFNFNKNGDSVQYVEDIYFGYKWYETADAEGYFSGVSNGYGEGYRGVVQYPFGFGLSYTEFSWSVKEASHENGDSIEKDATLTYTVTVTNEGERAGKDVVECYAALPYKKGGIEKEAVRLVAFAKTELLQPGESCDVTLAFTAYDLASYDAYDKNENGYACYELDEGDYAIRFMTDAHTPKGSLQYVCSCEETVFETDPVTGEEVYSRFTDTDAYLGVPIDGSTVGTARYLSRADLAGTMPSALAAKPADVQGEIARANKAFNDAYDVDEMPQTGKDGGLYLVTAEGGERVSLAGLNGQDESITLAANEDLFEKLGDYDSPLWDTLIDQMTPDELASLVQFGGFGTGAIASVGKPAAFDTDGPSGFNNSVLAFTGAKSDDLWTGYPASSLTACSWDTDLLKRMGECVGAQGNASSVSGWYAPGVNLHRSPYCGRNFEYYSEDATLSGKLASGLISGARSAGVYCYVKHFVCDELGDNPRRINTWLTEQNLRENYLKPFEIAVKEGGANAVMTAFNNVGPVWAGASYALCTQILRDEWGFRGSVITDYSTGDDVGGMNVRQGIRAGNDMWLNPNTTTANPLDKSDPTDIACAKRAAKNILYTYVDTYNTAKILKFTSTVFPWWIPVLVAADLVVLVTMALGAYFLFRPEKQKPEEGSSPAGDQNESERKEYKED